MILRNYRAACLALVQRVRSALRGKLRSDTWPADGGPPDPTAAEVMPLAAVTRTAAPGQELAEVVSHLQHFAYDVELDPEDWNDARHPNRYDFRFRLFSYGIRLHCAIGIGASAGNSRAAWLDVLNRANERSSLARFSLFESSNGRCQVRARALLSGAYSLPVFAVLIDMWHEDLDMVARMSESLADDTGEDDDNAAAPTVH